jgi:hypothetical protein
MHWGRKTRSKWNSVPGNEVPLLYIDKKSHTWGELSPANAESCHCLLSVTRFIDCLWTIWVCWEGCPLARDKWAVTVSTQVYDLFFHLHIYSGHSQTVFPSTQVHSSEVTCGKYKIRNSLKLLDIPRFLNLFCLSRFSFRELCKD